jgi:hypothetical protein
MGGGDSTRAHSELWDGSLGSTLKISFALEPERRYTQLNGLEIMGVLDQSERPRDMLRDTKFGSSTSRQRKYGMSSSSMTIPVTIFSNKTQPFDGM